MLKVEPTGKACGAVVTGLSLKKPISKDIAQTLRSAWLDNHVLIFPDQDLDNEDFVRFIEGFGPIGEDPYIKPIDGHPKIAAIKPSADDTGKLFADSWHSDWSFMEIPPAGTSLYGINIPPTGGDTLFANEHKSLDQMPDKLRARLEQKTAIHSAGRAYSRKGIYATDEAKGSMAIVTSTEADATMTHPLIRPHPESGRLGIFGGSYVVGLEDTDEQETNELLTELRAWQSRDEFVYRHKWEKGMLILWDNRSVLHKATGGFEGHDRLLHRLTVADDSNYYA